ncbi:MAG: hypothetical protein GC206_16795 [Alphaproteobacteria bacterium]|nr:hypothetical protein [Alphaproteobacteria bacterium]
MDQRLSDFAGQAAARLDAAETALIRGGAAPAQVARAALGAIAASASRLALPRCETIAQASAELIAQGEDSYPMALRGLMRLREVIDAIGESGREPAGVDDDLVAAATRTLPPSITDTLAQARARLMEIAPSARDPRLAAIIERLGDLTAEIEPDKETEAPAELSSARQTRGPRS